MKVKIPKVILAPRIMFESKAQIELKVAHTQ
jgi:hypothetical protein